MRRAGVHEAPVATAMSSRSTEAIRAMRVEVIVTAKPSPLGATTYAVSERPMSETHGVGQPIGRVTVHHGEQDHAENGPRRGDQREPVVASGLAHDEAREERAGRERD